ncbi:hypothetical protein BT96DRAFT_144437 [Gymnopus androsaceus JB14]|uniref:Uncharacterized protein n=1 Tax=Gymnopus androsaceus JB14 TaxID=1447944 RepID=A0A6A4HCD1_9AGAR|nr:hypothetical protein BT96DRAFT_144437 [Gymnopus androsaceus JB14]
MPETGVVAALFREIIFKADEVGANKTPPEDLAEHGYQVCMVKVQVWALPNPFPSQVSSSLPVHRRILQNAE